MAGFASSSSGNALLVLDVPSPQKSGAQDRSLNHRFHFFKCTWLSPLPLKKFSFYEIKILDTRRNPTKRVHDESNMFDMTNNWVDSKYPFLKT